MPALRAGQFQLQTAVFTKSVPGRVDRHAGQTAHAAFLASATPQREVAYRITNAYDRVRSGDDLDLAPGREHRLVFARGVTKKPRRDGRGRGRGLPERGAGRQVARSLIPDAPCPLPRMASDRGGRQEER